MMPFQLLFHSWCTSSKLFTVSEITHLSLCCLSLFLLYKISKFAIDKLLTFQLLRLHTVYCTLYFVHCTLYTACYAGCLCHSDCSRRLKIKGAAKQEEDALVEEQFTEHIAFSLSCFLLLEKTVCCSERGHWKLVYWKDLAQIFILVCVTMSSYHKITMLLQDGTK